MFLLLQTAYKTLVDPVSREEYDCALGFGETGHFCVGRTFADHVGECRRWEGQIVELKKRSIFRCESNEGSWGNRRCGPGERLSFIVIESGCARNGSTTAMDSNRK
ncbi:hypothetical protein L1987_70963 [Smallanthus sonchifolius]|uniref:Uncharacterized protein n=1 Tax=Smallanthus sonchifolius TaxID=185202 RepID=A0ACB9ARC5_9ASTR|nr:hypothetical protein L1987_70963 [Smallanthus sonchifolius]